MMNEYIIVFDSGAPSFRCGIKKTITAISPADAVVKLMQSIKVDCITSIQKLDNTKEECRI